MTALRARWARLDTDDKRAAFVAGVIIASLYLTALTVWATTGEPTFLIVMLGNTVLIAGLFNVWRVACRLFPATNQKDQP